ncbi:universal stress protein [Thalassospiraceae bacterium LMO-JJ14]|nr:universal stress protein [Thalassospiraceae bacterium LMO-JJ14]
MAVKDILVHLNGADSGQAVVEAAVGLAERHQARLVGLFAGVPYDMPTYVIAQLPAEVITAHQSHVEESAKNTADMFEKICEANGISHDYREGDWREPVDETVCMHARYADMVMIAQPASDSAVAHAREVADRIVLGSGAPVIIIPPASPKASIGDRVVVGWDGSAHAARAIRDALPILETASSVKVLAVDPKPGRYGLGDLPGADLAAFLATHGVTAEADHRKSVGGDIGATLLNEAADYGADLIVSGGYGHSRLGELLLGGVTDTLMEQATVAVLMSH